MATFKLSVARGQRVDQVGVVAGSAIAGSDAIELNIDRTRMAKGEVLQLLDVARQRLHSLPFPPAVAAPPLPQAIVSDVAADGWTANWRDGSPPALTPDTAPQTFAVDRQGWSAVAGAGDMATPATIAEQRIATQRLRQPVPNDAVLTPSTVALDDYVYATDAIAGVANGSTVESPKPIAKWRHATRRLVTDTCPVAVSAEHRDGIACVVLSISDGITTLTRTVTTPVVANRIGDQGAVIEYQHAFDVSGLAAGPLTRRAKVYPRIGGAASVLDSADQAAEGRGFGNMIDIKGARWFVYVDAGGNDTTGVVSTDPVLAAATPVATLNGAIVRARAAMPGNRTSGLEIRMRAGTWAPVSPTFNTYQDANSAEIVFTRDPDVPKASVLYSYSAATFWNVLYARFQDIRMARTANVLLNTATGGSVALRDIEFDLGGFTANVSARPHYWEGGCQLANVAGLALYTTGTCYMMRGVVAGDRAGATVLVDDWDIAGCDLRNVNVSSNNQPESGGMIEGAKIGTNASGGSGGASIAGINGVTLTGFAMRNVVIEFCGGGATPATGLRISADGGGSNTSHIVLRGVTIAGANVAGRANVAYDDASGTTRRTHALWRVEGFNAGQINHKSDRFVRDQGNADAPNRTGAWSVGYGVGWKGNLGRWPDAGGLPFRQDFPGLAALIATSTAAPIDAGFADYRATTFAGGAYTAGAGGGSYAIPGASTAKARLTGSRLPFDISGAARPAPDTAGAYA